MGIQQYIRWGAVALVLLTIMVFVLRAAYKRHSVARAYEQDVQANLIRLRPLIRRTLDGELAALDALESWRSFVQRLNDPRVTERYDNAIQAGRQLKLEFDLRADLAAHLPTIQAAYAAWMRPTRNVFEATEALHSLLSLYSLVQLPNRPHVDEYLETNYDSLVAQFNGYLQRAFDSWLDDARLGDREAFDRAWQLYCDTENGGNAERFGAIAVCALTRPADWNWLVTQYRRVVQLSWLVNEPHSVEPSEVAARAARALNSGNAGEMKIVLAICAAYSDVRQHVGDLLFGQLCVWADKIANRVTLAS